MGALESVVAQREAWGATGLLDGVKLVVWWPTGRCGRQLGGLGGQPGGLMGANGWRGGSLGGLGGNWEAWEMRRWEGKSRVG